MVMVSEDEKFNPASATREIFTQAINRALNDMTDAQIEALVQSAVGTEMSQRQMADLNLQTAIESSVSAIRSEMTQKASTSDVTAAVADEAAARQAADTTVYNSAADLIANETAARQSADAELHDAVGVVAALGAKNLLKSTTISQTINGVTFTVNDDQTITVNGTASANADFSINTALSLTAGSYILSGCPSGGDNSTTFKLQIQSIGYDTGNGLAFDLSAARNANVYIRIWSGYTANNLIFKPMIRRAEITDDTYVPYAPTNRELYETGQPSYDFIFGLGTALQPNDDLNNYNNAGKIYAATGAIAATISNTPWTASGFMAITIPLITMTTFMQFLLPSSMAGKWYRRRYTQGAWSPWTEYDGTQVASAQSAASLMQAGRLDAELTDAQEVTDDA